MRILRYLLAILIAVAGFHRAALGDSPVAADLPRVGLLSWSSCGGAATAGTGGEWGNFLQGLRDQGYTPGTDVKIECRSADGHLAQFDKAAAELVNIPVDVIVSMSDPASDAARRATKSIPVAAVTAALYSQTFSYSTSNTVGLVNNWLFLTGKRLEFLKEAVPGARKIGVLSNPIGRYQPFEGRARRAARDLSLELVYFPARTPEELANTFAQMKEQQVDAVMLQPDLTFSSMQDRIAGLAIEYGLPTMAWDTRMIEHGFLLAYSGNSADEEKRLAFYVASVLKGSAPFGMPTELESDFKLAVNLRTAAKLGLTMPRPIMAIAEKVLE